MRTLVEMIATSCKGYVWPLLLIFGLAGCSSPTAESNKESPDNTTEVPANRSFTVEIKQMKFVPQALTVMKGDTVVFVNRDMVEHDVTEETNKAWSSSPLKTDSSWTLIATDSQDYFCSLHEVMKGKIIVE